ncbi:MAG: 2-oxo acid dehydrogenase subunit E2 [Clostridia bacterium]|nr:2-oxo acid dehydrogenase subunit E2 [Clostridia bacterium]
MLGLRSDGRKIKSLDPLFRVIPHVMKERSDAHVYFSQEIPIKTLDEYIAKKEQEGIKMSYMNIIYAALVRMLAEKPALNRFIMDGRTYARHGIHISLAIKKGMTEDAEETTIKLPFTGSENIFEVKEILDKTILQNKDKDAQNDTDKLVKFLSLIPDWLYKLIVNILMYLDKHGMMPKFIIKLSPFHTSAFLTNVGSLGIDAIYHHLYNFGTTGVFLAMGKKKKSYIYEDDDIVPEKSISLAWVADERICDGFYYANALKSFYRYLKKPELLETNIEPKQDIR